MREKGGEGKKGKKKKRKSEGDGFVGLVLKRVGPHTNNTRST